MKIEHFNLKYSLLNFYSGVLKNYDTKDYDILITTTFGTLIGTPDFKFPEFSDETLKFDHYFYNHNLLLVSYTNLIEEKLIELNKNSKVPIEDEVFFSTINDEVVVLKNVTLNSNGKIFHLPSFTLFTESILGISYIEK